MLTQIVADDKNFYPEYLDELHKWCAEKVALTNGIISLEDMQQRENVYTGYDYFNSDGGDY